MSNAWELFVGCVFMLHSINSLCLMETFRRKCLQIQDRSHKLVKNCYCKRYRTLSCSMSLQVVLVSFECSLQHVGFPSNLNTINHERTGTHMTTTTLSRQAHVSMDLSQHCGSCMPLYRSFSLTTNPKQLPKKPPTMPDNFPNMSLKHAPNLLCINKALTRGVVVDLSSRVFVFEEFERYVWGFGFEKRYHEECRREDSDSVEEVL